LTIWRSRRSARRASAPIQAPGPQRTRAPRQATSRALVRWLVRRRRPILWAALAYLALAVTDFRGFNQFGVIGGVGMALCWATAYLLLPPLLVALDGGSPRAAAAGRRSPFGAFVSWLNRNHARAVLAATVALTLLAGVGVATYRGEVLEYDLTRLRAARSTTSGSAFWGGKVDEMFRAYLTPIVLHARTSAELDRVVAELERDRAALGERDPIRQVRTLSSAVPPDQAARLARLRDTLTDRRLARLDPEARRRALDFRPPADLRAVALEDLPDAIRRPLVERDGTAGRIALAFPRKVGQLSPDEMRGLTGLVRGAIARSGARAPAAGQSLLFIDVASAIMRDGPVATLLAFAAVAVLVLLALRSVRPTLLVLSSLALGVAWLRRTGERA
jgi:predicted RND superfamily exporter protein